MNAWAQQPSNTLFRIIQYTDDLLIGRAPAGSVIKLYYAGLGSFTPNTDAAFATTVAEADGTWIYSRSYYGLEPFEGPVVASVTVPGSSIEILESAVLGPDEVFIMDPKPCSETQTIRPPLVAEVPILKDRNGTIIAQRYGPFEVQAGTYTIEYQNRGGRTYRSMPLTIEGLPHVLGADLQLGCNEAYKLYTGQYTGPGASFLWENQADGTTIATTQEARLGPGKYSFYVTSQAGCRSSATVTVSPAPKLATVDLSSKTVRNTGCNQSNGSITGIKVSAAGNIPANYRWKDTKGNVYQTLDIYDLPADSYTLEAYSNDLCPSILATVEIAEENSIRLDISQEELSPASCGSNNGSVHKLSAINATIFNWYKDEDRTTSISTTLDLANAAPGFYVLVLENASGCKLEKTFQVPEGSPAIALLAPPQVKDDHCNQGQGSITGAKFNMTVNYIWLNEAGQEVSGSSDLLNVPAGNYTLLVKSDQCEKSFMYTVGNSESVLAAPVMENIQLCAASMVNISFKENSGSYRIYDANGNLRVQSSNKDLTLRVDQPGIYYAALASGTCESSRTMFSISFGSSGLNIPNIFSPNGDGINDQWIIKGLDSYTNPEVKIFNREGLLVFHSKGRPQPFDGRSKGGELPVGVYYYVVKASTECSDKSGSLTLIR